MAAMLKDIRETLIIGPDCRERFLPLGGSEGEALRAIGVQMAGLSDLSPQYRAARVVPPFHVVLVTMTGDALLHTHDDSRTIGPGTITVLPQGSSYAYEPAAETWSVVWFHLANRPRWRSLRGPRVVETHDGATLARLAAVYTDEIAAGREPVAAMVARALARALLEILAAGNVGDAEPSERLRAVMRAVESDLPRQWTEADLADIAHYSPQHLRRLAHQHWGMPPLKAVARARMTRAIALLEFSSLRLAAIAAAVGYSDEFSFGTAFRRQTGLSPGAWRDSRR
jgi:AraC-like DNA-binding protein